MRTIAVIATAMLAACGASDPATEAVAAPAATHVDTAALAAHSLAVNSLPEMRLLATSGGRDVLSRIVSCALPRGVSITAINGAGTPYSFAGDRGLAPEWAQRAATASEQHRVTACVLGRPIEPTQVAVINRV